jgi:WD40 repeat protein
VNGAVVLWNAETRSEVESWTAHRDPVDALAISADNRWLATGSLEDGTDSLRVYRLTNEPPFPKDEAFSDDRHVGGVSSLCFSPDSRFPVAGGFKLSGYTGPVVYEVDTGKRVGALF